MLWMKLLLGCSESSYSYPKPREVCDSQYFPAEPAPLPLDAELWQMRERWHNPVDEAWFVHVAAAPFSDTNGDGQIGLGDQMDLVAMDVINDSVTVLDGQTGQIEQTLPGHDFTLADVDALHPGPEIVLFDYDVQTLSLADRQGVFLTAPFPETHGYGNPLLDLDGDSLLELVGRRGVYDLATGTLRFPFSAALEGVPATADLDGDGLSELIVHLKNDNHLTILDATGAVLATCASPEEALARYEDDWALAVGNLDEDEALEVVGGGTGGMVVCDRDGTVLAQSASPVEGTIALAQLDADPMPEVLASNGSAILGFEHDLTPMAVPTQLMGMGRSWLVADFDSDGVHELLAWSPEYVTIHRATSTPTSFLPLPGVEAGSTETQFIPLVVDLDGDGLAEVVIPEWSRGGLTVLDNPLGGWPVHEAGTMWTGLNAHIGALSPSGQVQIVGPEVVNAGLNVWNGRPATPPQCSSAIALDLRDVCVDSCQGDATLTVFVSNTGVVPLSTELSLQIWVEGALLAEVPVPSVAPELSEPVQLALPVADLSGPIEARLASPNEALCEVPSSFWNEPVCP